MNTLVLKPRIDNRENESLLQSRIGLAAPAHVFDAEDDLLELVKKQHSEEALHCILVDEAQFMTRSQVFGLSEVVDKLNIPVLAFGLRTDFQGELFEGSQHLLAWSDELRELKTICHSGKKATMVLRFDDNGQVVRQGQQVEIGGNEKYLSVSRVEFKKVFYDSPDTFPED